MSAPTFNNREIRVDDVVTIRKRMAAHQPPFGQALELLLDNGWEIVHVRPAGWEPCDNTFDCIGSQHFQECPRFGGTTQTSGATS